MAELSLDEWIDSRAAASEGRQTGPHLMYLVKNFILFLLDEYFTRELTTEAVLVIIRLAFIGCLLSSKCWMGQWNALALLWEQLGQGFYEWWKQTQKAGRGHEKTKNDKKGKVTVTATLLRKIHKTFFALYIQNNAVF